MAKAATEWPLYNFQTLYTTAPTPQGLILQALETASSHYRAQLLICLLRSSKL